MTLRCAATALASILLATPLVVLPAQSRADACDGLTVRLIRATGASLAGRDGRLVVFRSADADRMSLSCGSPAALLFRSALREPPGRYFALIGLAGRALTGADADAVETLALTLHQATLLTTQPRTGSLGTLVMRCEPGDRPDGFHRGALCRIAGTRRSGSAGKRRPGPSHALLR